MRIDHGNEGLQAIAGLEAVVAGSTLEPELLELVKMRASQLNGCAHSLDMHAKDGRARGEAAVVASNGWNRLAVGFRSPVGGYVSPHSRVMEGAGR